MRNTEPQAKYSSSRPEMSGPSIATPPPSADHIAIECVRAGPDQSAVMRARVVGYAMPAESPPATRATNSTVSLGANPAASEAGIVISMPRTIISLRP